MSRQPSHGAPPPQRSGSGAAQDDLAGALAELARALEGERDAATTSEGVVRAAVDLIPGAEEASISFVTGRKQVLCHAATSDLPRRVDALQAEMQQGPCLDAVYEQQTVSVPDLRTDERWPDFARRAREAGAASMLAFRLYVDGDNLGALNLYGREPGSFDDESEHVGALFAAHAAVAVARVEKQQQLVQALSTRDLIGQAKGILMERYKITGDEAFSLLVRTSQHTNTKLRDVADELIRSGELAGRSP